MTLLALPGALGSAIAGAFFVDWYGVYGSWPTEGQEFGGVVDVAVAVFTGLMAWMLTLLATVTRAPRTWLVLVVITFLSPALVVNILTFQAARQQACEIRASNGHDPRLHDVPWPLALRCPYHRPGAGPPDLRRDRPSGPATAYRQQQTTRGRWQPGLSLLESRPRS